MFYNFIIVPFSAFYILIINVFNYLKIKVLIGNGQRSEISNDLKVWFCKYSITFSHNYVLNFHKILN